jgi:DNA-binding NarL/FixJ family response regulator
VSQLPLRTDSSPSRAVSGFTAMTSRRTASRSPSVRSPAASPPRPTAGSTAAVDPPLRVLVADDDEPMCTWLCTLLAADPRFTVCGQASDAPAAVRLALESKPDLCLLDVRMPGGGVAAAAEITARLPLVTVVMLTGSDDDRDLFAALRAGAAGYLLKDIDPGELPDRLVDAVSAGATLSRTLLARLVTRFRDPNALRRTLAVPGVHLTSREWQVLELLRAGHSTAQVARRLSLSPATVRSHRARIVRKLRESGTSDEEVETLLQGSAKGSR